MIICTTELSIYKTLISPTATGTLNKLPADLLDRLKGKYSVGLYPLFVIRRWRKNIELYTVYEELGITYNNRIQRLKWLGYGLMMENSRKSKS